MPVRTYACLPKFAHVAKQNKGMKIALNVSLLEGHDFAREDVFYIESNAILIQYGSTNELECEKTQCRSTWSRRVVYDP